MVVAVVPSGMATSADAVFAGMAEDVCVASGLSSGLMTATALSAMPLLSLVTAAAAAGVEFVVVVATAGVAACVATAPFSETASDAVTESELPLEPPPPQAAREVHKRAEITVREFVLSEKFIVFSKIR